MTKLRSFYDFNRLVESTSTYNDLIREFPEFNLIFNTALGVITAISALTNNQISPDRIIAELNKISDSGVLQKAKLLDDFIDEVISKITFDKQYSDIESDVKEIARKIQVEVKKLSSKYDNLLDLNSDTEVQKDIDGLISLWCQINSEILKKNTEVSESAILERNMFEVFSEDLVSIRVKVRSLMSDIDTYLKNKGVRASSRLRDIKSKATDVMDEIGDGIGYGQNWNNFDRGDAKKRIAALNTIVNDLTSKYTEIVFSEKDFSEEYGRLVSEINDICNKINLLVKQLTEKGLETQEGVGDLSSDTNLAWSIVDPSPSSQNDIIGLYKKRKWVTVISGSEGKLQTGGVDSTLYPNLDIFNKLYKEQKGSIKRKIFNKLYKEQEGSIKREESEWFVCPKEGADWDNPNWVKVDDPARIDFFNKCWQYNLVQLKKWVCENSKSPYDSLGNARFTDSESEKFVPSESDIEKFNPIKAVKELEKYPNYRNSYYIDSVELTPDDSGDSSGGGSSDNTGETLENYYHTDKIKAISFKGPKGDRYYNDLPNKIEGGPNRTWFRGSGVLNTKWFKPGTFSEVPSDFWMRLKNGIWEYCQKDSKNEPKEGTDSVASLDQKIKPSVIPSAVTLINKSNEELSDKIREQNQISKYWGMGKGKTNISKYPWGSSEGEMKVEKQGTAEERCGGEISPSAWGRSSINDDVILYCYKNGGFEIGDDDYSDRIWGDWGIDSDKDEFFIKWTLYSTSSTRGWKSIQKGRGTVGQTTMFTCPINDGLKGALDKAAIRFMEVFY